MTSKVQIIVNGSNYVATYIKKTKAGEPTQTGELRGGERGQSFVELSLGQDETISVTETYSPLEAK